VLNGFGWPHLLIIAVLLVVLFGAKRLPDAARGIGRSMHIFKTEVRSMQEEQEGTNPPAGPPSPAPQQYAPQQIAQQPVAQVAPVQPVVQPMTQQQPVQPQAQAQVPGQQV